MPSILTAIPGVYFSAMGGGTYFVAAGTMAAAAASGVAVIGAVGIGSVLLYRHLTKPEDEEEDEAA